MPLVFSLFTTVSFTLSICQLQNLVSVKIKNKNVSVASIPLFVLDKISKLKVTRKVPVLPCVLHNYIRIIKLEFNIFIQIKKKQEKNRKLLAYLLKCNGNHICSNNWLFTKI